MTRSISRLAAFAVAAVGLAAPAAAETRFDDAEKQEIRTIVRDYLIANPEVLVEAMDALRTKQADEERIAQAEAMASAGESLRSAPEGTAIGNPDGDVTVVEFFDYNCGYCREALEDMERLVGADENVRFVLKEFPILGADSIEASRVSMAVRELAPDQYANFHRQLLGRRGKADREAAMEVAGDLGIDRAMIEEKLDDPAIMTELQDIQIAAAQLRINGTPSYILGEEVIQARVGFDQLQASVDNIRTCGSPRC